MESPLTIHLAEYEARLDPQELHKSFLAWIEGITDSAQVAVVLKAQLSLSMPWELK